MRWIFHLCFLLGVISVNFNIVEAECDFTEFSCSNGRCINMAWKCDGDDDCQDNSDEIECPSTTCSDGFFRCDNGKCVPERWVCDNTSECGDDSDEKPEMCKNQSCNGYRCKDSSQCIRQEWKCDGQADCPKEDDEMECHNVCDPVTEFECNDKRCISVRWVCDHHEDCDDGSDEVNCPKRECDTVGEKMCNDGECLNDFYWCDGDVDCKDKSDEANCTNTFTGQDCGPTEFQCHVLLLGPQCIHSGWQCDGDEDCSDGSDEISCTGRTCSPKEKMCHNNTCIMEEFFCDGEIDCENGEDEVNCTFVVPPWRSCLDDEFDCGNKCIIVSKICDGTVDCDSGADEALDLHCPLQVNNSCEKNNGGCNQICIPNMSLESGRRCECYTGFNLIPNSNTECDDIDECRVSDICSQVCTNTKGSYKCECFTGYTLKNHHYCKANDGNQAELILSDNHELRRYHLDTYHYSLLLNREVLGAVALDFDIRNNMIFWTDVQSKKIYSANLTTNEVELIIASNIHMPDGLAIDWVHGNLYLSDTGLDRIEVARLNGSSRKTLIDKNLSEPRALVVDPGNGWMYWTDWGSRPKIEKCGMNGQLRKEIVTKDISWPNGLTIDYVQQRLYWVDAKLHIIGSSDLDGNNHKLILRDHKHLGHPFAITVFEDYLYWTDWMTNAVHRVSKYGHENISNVALGLKTPMDVHIYHIYRQPISINHCGENNGGCSHLCLPVPQIRTSSPLYKQSECACPDTMVLDDTHNCRQSGIVETPKKPSQPNTNVTSPNRPQTYRPAMKTTVQALDETTVKYVSKVEDSAPDSSVNATHIETLRNEESVGLVAVIVIIILLVIGLCVSVVIFLLLKRYKSRNVKSMNFDNPVYRKTTTDDHLIMDKSGSRSSLSQSLQPLNPDNGMV